MYYVVATVVSDRQVMGAMSGGCGTGKSHVRVVIHSFVRSFMHYPPLPHRF